MNISYWEKDSFFAPRDVIVVGGGLVGLWSAWHIKRKHPKRSVLIVDQGVIPTGASTRNAGFACFGSLTELLADEKSGGLKEMLALVAMRYRGLKKIRKTFRDPEIGYEASGGYELIDRTAFPDINRLRSAIDRLNHLLDPVTETAKTFSLRDNRLKDFAFRGDYYLVENHLEGQLHSGRLCEALLQLVQAEGVKLLSRTGVSGFRTTDEGVVLETNLPTPLVTKKLLICTNGFAKLLLPELDIQPARGQVLVTSPIAGLPFRGTFHYDEGFYYFRNIGDRVLIGGARNKFLREEETFSLDISDGVQAALEEFLRRVILPDRQFTIEDRWAGTMGMGDGKMPIIREISPGVYCAVRMSGMGVALAPIVGKKAAALLD